MSYTVINGLPTKFKYSNNMLLDTDLCNDDISEFFNSRSYKKARSKISVGVGVDDTGENRVDAFKDFMVQNIFRVADRNDTKT